MLAIARPSGKDFTVSPLAGRTALVVYEPKSMKTGKVGEAALMGDLVWIEVPYLEDAMFDFLAEVAHLLKGDKPARTEKCEHCHFKG